MAITEATKVGNVLLGHKFRMEFNGYAPAMIQECDIPERNFETVKYGGAGQTPEVKVAGGEVIGEFDLTVIVPVNGDERLFWQVWQDEVIAGDCTVYWRDATLIQLGPNDDPNMYWDIYDCWPKKTKMKMLKSSGQNEHVQLSITMACNDFRGRV